MRAEPRRRRRPLPFQPPPGQRLPVTVAVLLALMLALVLDAPVRQAVARAPEGLVRAAESVTWIGNTAWMFPILLALILGGGLGAGLAPRAAARRRADRVLALAVAGFLLILLSGIAVQVLKHLLARPRPPLADSLGVYGFAPLSFGFEHASFPSGHATTMGALAVFAALVVPRLAPVAAALAMAVAVSRVLVLKHYPSDVVAGLALGALCAWGLVRGWQATGLLPPSPARAVLGLWRGGTGRDRDGAAPGLGAGLARIGLRVRQGVAVLRPRRRAARPAPSGASSGPRPPT